MDLLVNPSNDPAFNLALEELIATEYPREALMLWRNRPSIIVGCNQNTEAEIDPVYVREHHIDVVRRITGGGAVYHDLGNINYTIAANDRCLAPEDFARNAAPVLNALRSFGIPAEFSGRNDILADGRKVSGSAKSVFAKRTLFHATLLFDVDLDVLSQALRVDESKIRAKGIKSVRSRVANLKEYLPQWDAGRFLAELENALLAALNISGRNEIPAELTAKAEALATEKYRQWEWNYGSRLSYSYAFGRRFPFGSVRVEFNIIENRLAGTIFTGDFFGMRHPAELAEALNGTPANRPAIAAKIAELPVSDFIQGMTGKELLTLFEL